MVQLTLTADDEASLAHHADLLHDRIIEKIDKEYSHLPIQVFGPFEAQVYKLNEKYRMRMILKCRLNKRTRALLEYIMTEANAVCSGRVSVSIDINPSNL